MNNTTCAQTMYQRFGKRVFDVAVTVPAVIVLLPVLLLIAVLVRMWLGSPVLFAMERPGLNGKPFILYKFRTMMDVVDVCGRYLPDEQRLTFLGRALRLLSLDELPELYNVLKGEMSLVGPRPLRMEYLDWYTPEQMRRHDVLPGITGWAQIHGRNAISWERKLELDAWYVNHVSWWVDVKIILLTLPKVLFSENVEYLENATLADFLRARPHLVVRKDPPGSS
jgi:sugar transferase EpsL